MAMGRMQRLLAAGCRIDGLYWDKDGVMKFRATPSSGEWTDAQIAQVKRVLGVSQD